MSILAKTINCSKITSSGESCNNCESCKSFDEGNSLNIFELHKLSKNYLKIGYSNTDIKIHLNKIYSMTVFYMLMTILVFIIPK